MQTRIVGLEIGDWSGDGHEKSKKFRVQITGADVSNEALTAAKDRAAEAVGFPLDHLFAGYEDCVISMEHAEALVAAGITPAPCDDEISEFPFYYVEVDESNPDEYDYRYETYSAVALAMSYLGYRIDGFEYEILVEDEPEYVVGAGNAIIPSFGYGLLS